MLTARYADMNASGFEDYCRRKEDAALAARLTGLMTVAQDTAGADVVTVGSDWTRALFDGEFYRSAGAYGSQLPAVSLFIGRSPGGDLVAGHQLVHGCGDTTRHLIHEGLSRVDADAVLGSLGAASARDVVFSVWHPELVALRRDAGHDRHPAQVVVTASGNLPFDECRLFLEPTLRVIVVTTSSVVPLLQQRLRTRPAIEILDGGEPLSLFTALVRLREKGLRVISAIGGQRTAAALLRGGLVTDLHVTRHPRDHIGTDGSFYDGPPLLRRRLLAKAGRNGDAGVCFEHLVRPSAFARR